MTFTLEFEKEHIYFAVTLVVLIIQLYNTWRIGRLRSEIDALWSQISIMAIATGSAFDKIDKKIDGKGNKPTE